MISFVAAAIVSAGIVGILCGILGALLAGLAAPVLVIVAALIGIVAVVYGLGEVTRANLWVPQRHWLVPSQWSWYGSLRYAAAFGSILGAGFFTLIPFIGYHILLIVCVLVADPIRSGALMTFFAMARTLPVMAIPLVMWIRKEEHTHDTASTAIREFIQVNRFMAALRSGVLFAVAASLLRGIL